MSQVFEVRLRVGERDCEWVVDFNVSVGLGLIAHSGAMRNLIIVPKLGQGIGEVSMGFSKANNCLFLRLGSFAVRIATASHCWRIEANGQGIAANIKFP
jgi:hypothetical protein